MPAVRRLIAIFAITVAALAIVSAAGLAALAGEFDDLMTTAAEELMASESARADVSDSIAEAWLDDNAAARDDLVMAGLDPTAAVGLAFARLIETEALQEEIVDNSSAFGIMLNGDTASHRYRLDLTAALIEAGSLPEPVGHVITAEPVVLGDTYSSEDYPLRHTSSLAVFATIVAAVLTLTALATTRSLRSVALVFVVAGLAMFGIQQVVGAASDDDGGRSFAVWAAASELVQPSALAITVIGVVMIAAFIAMTRAVPAGKRHTLFNDALGW